MAAAPIPAPTVAVALLAPHDEPVGDLVGPQARELLAQGGEVAYRDAGSDIDDQVGDMTDRRLGALPALAYAPFH